MKENPRLHADLRRLLGLSVAVLLSACAVAPSPSDGPNPRDGQILTRADIEKTGARDGWEALRRGQTKLNIQMTREGTPPKVTHRGVDSFLLSPEVLLVVDGVHMTSLETLREIRTTNIEYIQVLSGRVATVKYGTAAGNGAVVVQTGVPPSNREARVGG